MADINWAGMDRSELLIRYGFIKGSAKGNYKKNETGIYEPNSGYKLNKGDADEEVRDMDAFRQPINTGFPTAHKSLRLTYEVYDLSLEEPYFWIHEYMRQNFPTIIKVEDSFAASENSAFFGVTQQRLGAQQDKISGFLATTGKMVKELFQMVRELRIIDERMGYYDEVEEQLPKALADRGKSSEITLKGMFVDLVQGGGKSAASVYGMSTNLEFLTLPDLFFDAPPFATTEELEKYVNSLKENFNENVLRVLVRHLRQYTEWRKRTHQEHRNRKRFQLQYLRQHFDIIQMYINWVKPYLRNVMKLSLKEKNMDSAEIISSFEGSMMDIEVLFCQPASAKSGKAKASGYEIVMGTWHYRTRPEMKSVQEGYQRGPVHIGRMEMQLRAYKWLDEELEQYKAMKAKEAWIWMGDVSSSVQQAMESLGVELENYLAEAKGTMNKQAPAPKSTFGISKGVKLKDVSAAKQAFKKGQPNAALFHCWNGYHTFKKSHRLVAW